MENENNGEKSVQREKSFIEKSKSLLTLSFFKTPSKLSIFIMWTRERESRKGKNGISNVKPFSLTPFIALHRIRILMSLGCVVRLSPLSKTWALALSRFGFHIHLAINFGRKKGGFLDPREAVCSARSQSRLLQFVIWALLHGRRKLENIFRETSESIFWDIWSKHILATHKYLAAGFWHSLGKLAPKIFCFKMFVFSTSNFH